MVHVTASRVHLANHACTVAEKKKSVHWNNSSAFVACKFVTPTVLHLSRLLTTVLFSTALRCSTTEDSLKLLLTNHRRFYARACLRVLPRVYEPNLNGLWPEPPAWLAKTSTQGRSFKAIAVSFKKRKEKKRLLQATNNWHQDSGPKGWHILCSYTRIITAKFLAQSLWFVR